MSSGSSTESRRRPDASLQAWHFYLLLSMAAAIWAVVVSKDTHPAALLLISAAVLAAGLTAAALHRALAGFLGARAEPAGPSPQSGTRDALAAEKALVLRSIKELEFDHAMKKVSDGDFAEIGARLRARAIELMRDLDGPSGPEAGVVAPVPAPVRDPASRAVEPSVAAPAEPPVFAQLADADERARPVCAACGRENDSDARFCKHCGARVS
jgi:hypothetical protein